VKGNYANIESHVYDEGILLVMLHAVLLNYRHMLPLMFTLRSYIWWCWCWSWFI